MNTGTVLIRSISRQVPRIDDVLKTNRVWKRRGDVVEVQASEASHYLAHPMEWERITPEQYEAQKVSDAMAKELVSEVSSKWNALALDDLKHMRAELDTEIKRRESIPGKPVDREIQAFADSEPVKLSQDDPATQAAAADRMKKIALVISEMDRNDPAHWSKTPRELPRVSKVSELFGAKVSQEEIVEALKLVA